MRAYCNLRISSILNNWDDATNAYADAMDSAGVATEAQSTYMESLNAKIEQFNASVQELYYDFLSSDLAAGVVDFGTSFIQTIDNIIDSIGSLSTALLALVGGNALKSLFTAFRGMNEAGGFMNALSVTSLGKFVGDLGAAFSLAGESFSGMQMSLSGLQGALSATGSAFGQFFSSHALGTIAIAGAAIAAIVTAVNNYNEAQRKAAQEAAVTWGESNDTINDYKERITELRTELDAGTLSEEEAYEAKSELLSIQDALSESYGSQVEGIDLVNGSYERQLQLLDKLSIQDAQIALKEYGDQFDIAKSQVENFSTVLERTYLNADEQAVLRNLIEPYKDYLRMVEDQETGEWTLEYVGNAEYAEEVLDNLKRDLNDLQNTEGNEGLLDWLYEDIADATSKAEDTLEDYGDTYENLLDMQIKADEKRYASDGMIQHDAKTASQWLEEYQQSIEDYNAALESGNAQQIEETATAYQELQEQVQWLLDHNENFDYASQFQFASDALDDAALSAYNFEQALQHIDVDDTGIDRFVSDVSSKLEKEGWSDIDFKVHVIEADTARNTSDNYYRLAEEAENAGISLDALAQILVDLGILSGTTSDEIDEVSMSLAEMLSSTEDNNLSEQIDNFQSDIDDIQSALDQLRNGEEVNLADLIQDFPELTDYMDDLEGGLEQLQFDTIQSFSDSLSEMLDATDGWTKSEYQAFDDLYSSLMSNVDFSAYADQYKKSLKSFTTMMSESTAYQDLGLIDQLESAIGQNEYAMEAVVMLSMNPDAANWTYQEFCQQLENAVLYIQLRVTEDSLTELQDTLDGLQEEQDLIESSQSLSEAMNIKKTTKDYKQLIDNSKKQVANLKDQNNLLEVQKGLYEDLGRDTKDIQSQINDNTKAMRSALEDQISWNNEALALNYNQAAEGVDAIRTALSEATSDTLLSQDTISDLINTLSVLEDFDATDVFYQTANGVDLNTTALKHLEDEYVALKKQDYQSQLAELGKEYQESKNYVDELSETYDGLTEAQERAYLAAAGYRHPDDIESDIMYVDLLANELDGLTSAYQTWINAQSQGSYAEAYENMGDYYSTAEDLINRGWVGNEGLNAYLDLMLSADQRTGDTVADFQKLTQTIEGTDHSLMDYFQYDDNGKLVNGGLYDFIDDVIDTMGDAYARFDEETGQYELGVWTDEDVQAVADRFGTTAETVYWMIDAMKEAGFEVETTENYLQDAIDAAQKGTESLKELQSEGGVISEELDLDYEVSELSTDEVEEKIAELEAEKARIEVDYDANDDEAQEAIAEIDATIGALENQRVQLNIEAEIEEGNLQELDALINEEGLEAFAVRVGIDVDNEEELTAVAEVVQQLAQNERVEVAVETAVEETGMSLEELSQYDKNEITEYVNVDAADAEATVEYIQNAFDEEKTWDMTVRIDEDQFNQLTQEQEGTVDVDANTEPAMTAVDELVNAINEMEATITVNTETTGSEESSAGSTEVSSSATSIPGTINYTAVFDEETTAPELDGEAKYTPVFDEDVSAPSLDGVANYTIGEYPTTIEEHASGIADYEVGDYPKDIPVNADVNNAETAISGLKAEIESIDATISVNVDTETLASQLGELNSYLPTEGASVDVTANVSGTEDVNALTNAIGVLTGKVVQVIAQVTGEGAVNSLRNSIGALTGKVVQVIAQVAGQASVDALRNSIAAVQSKTVTVTSVSKTVNEAMGTAHAEGTTIMNTWNNYRHSIGAYANGTRQNWALPRNETALTNETGQESIVFKMRLCMATCIENLSNC